MLTLIRRLYTILRSITGEGNLQTLQIIKESVPSLHIHEVPSGTQCLDWTVPPEWNCRSAKLYAPDGRLVVDMAAHNLHVLNYSTPYSGEVTWDELEPHLFSLPAQPDIIPYRTSYYVRNWGFCLADSVKQALPREGRYRVEIDTTLDEGGSLTYGEFFLPGRTEDEILLSVHICHPQLAVDNLGAIAVAAQLAAAARPGLCGLRILFVPGTIGPVVWMSRNLDRVTHAAPVATYVLALAGLDAPICIKEPSPGVFRALSWRYTGAPLLAARELDLETRILPYEPYGYDERQYNTPGTGMLAVRLGQADYNKYPEYHTSADNLELVSEAALARFYAFVRETVDAAAAEAYYQAYTPAVTVGEPQYGRHGVYARLPQIWPDKAEREMAMFWLCSSSDLVSITAIAQQSGLPVRLLTAVAEMLIDVGLLVVGRSAADEEGEMED